MMALPMVMVAALLASAAAAAAPPPRRVAVVAGVNRGPADRVALRYAVADAERFAKLVTGMGGVASEDCVVLREPTRLAFLEALAAVKARAASARVFTAASASRNAMRVGSRRTTQSSGATPPIPVTTFANRSASATA